MKKNRYIALFAGLSLALMSSPALAYPSADTMLVSGYDVESQVVLYGVSSVDQEDTDELTLDCALDGPYTYDLGEDGLDEDDDFETREVTGLMEGEDAAGFGYESTNIPEDDSDDLADFSVEYGTDTDGDALGSEECELTAVTIEPNGEGEINHGTIVSTFARLLKGGNGCLIKLFAQSDYGKTGFEGDGEELSVVLESHETACRKGPNAANVDDDEDDSNGNGRPDRAPGPPPWAGNGDADVSGDDETDRGGPPPWAGPKNRGGDDS